MATKRKTGAQANKKRAPQQHVLYARIPKETWEKLLELQMQRTVARKSKVTMQQIVDEVICEAYEQELG